MKKVGFRTNMGHEGAGFLSFTRRRGGGYYLDVGASQLVIDGKIKLKNDSKIKRYTKTGFEFDDGSKFDADVILFATGYVPCRSVRIEAGLMCMFPCVASPPRRRRSSRFVARSSGRA